MKSNRSQITRLLNQAREGDSEAAESLLPLIYSELHGLAHVIFQRERSDHTLQPTALIHEAWLKMAGHLSHVGDRKHFLLVASRAMRQVLADHARGRHRAKRVEGRKRVTLCGSMKSGSEAGIDLVDLHDTLTRLAKLNARHAQVVEMRILGGLTIAEAAEALGVSHNTVESDWFMAKAWLRKELSLAG